MEKYLEIGEVVAVHGIKGELKIYPWTDSPDSLDRVKLLYSNGGKTKYEVKAHAHGRMILCKIAGIDNPEQARAFVGRTLFADRADLKQKEGSFYLVDLVGLKVVHSDTGEDIGSVCSVEQMPANDVMFVNLANGETRLIPVVKEFVTEINVEAGYIKLRPIAGMLADED